MYENEINLRRLTNDDYELFASIASQRGEYDILSPADIVGFPIETRDDFENALFHYEEDGNGMFALTKSKDGEIVGILSEKKRNDEASIGVFVAAPHRNSQYATTAIEEAIEMLDEKVIKNVAFEVPQKDKRAVYLAEHFTNERKVENGNLIVYNVSLQKHRDEYIPRMVGLEIELDLCSRVSAMAEMQKSQERDDMIKDTIVEFCANHPNVNNKAILSKVFRVIGKKKDEVGKIMEDSEPER